MVVHKFVCDMCGIVVEDTNTKCVHKCPNCKNQDMRWDLTGNVSGGSDYEHISDSLAIHTDLIPEHKKLFPGIELTSEGQPIFTSSKQQERYAEKCGFYKKRQRIKSKGKRII